jgi:hypothetical protein
MSTEAFVRRCHELAFTAGGGGGGASDGCTPGPETSDADSLIGLFQQFRPDGEALIRLFQSLPDGDALGERLRLMYAAAGNDRRPQGGRDAYFIVRSPQPMTVEIAEHHGVNWLDGLRQLAQRCGDNETADLLGAEPKVRVLEGLPPKKPKAESDRTRLFHAVTTQCVKLTEQIEADPHAELLRPAYYFIACDAMLRDYLMWPFYRDRAELAEPFGSYFHLWRHGVKFRIFRDDQVDLYLPRETVAS